MLRFWDPPDFFSEEEKGDLLMLLPLCYRLVGDARLTGQAMEEVLQVRVELQSRLLSRSLELEPGLAGAVGDFLDATVVDVPVAIEHDLLDLERQQLGADGLADDPRGLLLGLAASGSAYAAGSRTPKVAEPSAPPPPAPAVTRAFSSP